MRGHSHGIAPISALLLLAALLTGEAQAGPRIALDAQQTVHPLPPPPVSIDELEWERIATSIDTADFDRFLQKFPQSRFAAQALSRRASLVTNPSGAATPPTTAGQN